ncbi:MAG: hypothetical protein U1F43_15390 [Myxococcota bacterium]
MSGRGARASGRLAVALALATGLASAGGGPLQAVPDAVRDWRDGRQTRAVASARAEVQRWVDGNDVAPAELERALAAVDRVFDEDLPIVVPGEVGMASPGESVDIDRQMSADLLSNRATAVLRALHSAAALGLTQRGPEILAVIFRREPVKPDGGLLADAPPALRSLATKRLALRALEALATPKRPVL